MARLGRGLIVCLGFQTLQGLFWRRCLSFGTSWTSAGCMVIVEPVLNGGRGKWFETRAARLVREGRALDVKALTVWDLVMPVSGDDLS